MRDEAFFMLTKEQIQIFKQQLEEEKVTVESELGEMKNPQKGGLLATAFPSMPQEAGSPDESMDEVEQFESDLSTHRHLTHRLVEITNALAKIEKKVYGFCEKCKREIPLNRLEANPAATTCLKCK